MELDLDKPPQQLVSPPKPQAKEPHVLRLRTEATPAVSLERFALMELDLDKPPQLPVKHPVERVK